MLIIMTTQNFVGDTFNSWIYNNLDLTPDYYSNKVKLVAG